jgi:hypothetical protein
MRLKIKVTNRKFGTHLTENIACISNPKSLTLFKGTSRGRASNSHVQTVQYFTNKHYSTLILINIINCIY